MSVLVYIESENNKFKKSSYEALSYGKALADNIGETVCGVVVNCSDTESLNAYGADKIININSSDLSDFSSKKYAHAIVEVIKSENSKIVILSSSPNSKYLGAYLSGITDSSFVSNVVELPESNNPFTVKRTCFTNKAFSLTELNSDIKIISITSNSFGIVENPNNPKNEIERSDASESIIMTLKIRDLRYLSILSTLGRKIVVKRNEKTSMPIIENKYGKTLQTNPPEIINNSNL